MKQKHSYDQLIAEIAEAEARLVEKEKEARSLHRELSVVRKSLAASERRLKIMQTLGLGLMASLEAEKIYPLVCQSIVSQLEWEFSLMVSLHGTRVSALGACGMNERQMHAVDDYLAANPTFRDAYLQRTSFATFALPDAQALMLRTLFQADEVAAVPLLFGGQSYGCLLVGASGADAKHLGRPDLDFLGALGGQVAHALQNSSSFFDLEAQNLKLRQLDDMKNTFISITSHQLRTPLSIVKWILSLLESDQSSPERRQELVGQAYETNERMIHVVNNLLNVSRIQDGELPYSPQTLNLASLLHDLCRGSLKLAEQHKVEVREELSEGLPLIEADPILFKEALQNLVDNAILYNQEGGFVRLKATVHGTSAVIEIANSGPGILPEDMEKIFSQFYRSPEAVRLQPNGNGLGLFLTKAIIRRQGGDIACRSEPGGETVFTVTLPLN